MDSVAFFLGFILVTGVAVHVAEAQTTVTGTVFCDRCKDGKLSALDYPLAGNIYTHLHRVDNTFFVCFKDVFFLFLFFAGSNITVTCIGANGQPSLIREGTTNLVGNYMMRFDGTPDLSNCSVHLSSNHSQPGARACGLASGPAQKPKLAFRLFNMGMYTVDSLLAQPALPASACSNSSVPALRTRASTPGSPTPIVRLPRLPRIRIPSAPPLPFIEATACPDKYIKFRICSTKTQNTCVTV